MKFSSIAVYKSFLAVQNEGNERIPRRIIDKFLHELLGTLLSAEFLV